MAKLPRVMKQLFSSLNGDNEPRSLWPTPPPAFVVRCTFSRCGFCDVISLEVCLYARILRELNVFFVTVLLCVCVYRGVRVCV